MKTTWENPNNHLARIAAVTALVIVTLLAAIVVIDVRASDATAATGEAGLPGGPYVSAEACPEATAQFVELGLQPPDTFTPDCPNPERLGRDLAKTVESWPHPPATAPGR